MKTIGKRHILLIGKEQSGKSHYIMDESRKRMINHNIIQIHFAYATHNIEENQNRHVNRVFAQDRSVRVLRKLQEIRNFTKLVQSGENVFNDGKIIISCIGNHYTLKDILHLVSLTNHDYKFDVYLDEGDTYAVNHDNVSSTIQKDNLILSIAHSQNVLDVWEITATPQAQTVSNSNFTEIIHLQPRSGYHGVDGFTFNNTVTVPEMKQFENARALPPSIKAWIEAGIQTPGQLSLISTSHKIENQLKMAQMVSEVAQQNSAVIVVNSTKETSTFVGGKPVATLKKPTTTQTLDECWNRGFETVFVIGQRSLNRSVTIEDSNKNYDACRILFNCAIKQSGEASSSDPEILQRVSRIAGYGPHKREVTCTWGVADVIRAANRNRDNLVKDILPHKLAEERHKYLYQYDKLMRTNLWGSKDNNFKLTRVVVQKHASTTDSPEFKQVNEIFIHPLHQLTRPVQEQLESGRSASDGSPFHRWVTKTYGVEHLYRYDAGGANSIPMHVPNYGVEGKAYRRDMLWKYEKQTLILSRQLNPTIDHNFSICNPDTMRFENYIVTKDPNISEIRIVSK